MENKDFPELESQELPPEEPVLPPEQPAPEDFFADILPDQVVAEEDAFRLDPEPAEETPVAEAPSVEDYVAAIDEQIAAENQEQADPFAEAPLSEIQADTDLPKEDELPEISPYRDEDFRNVEEDAAEFQEMLEAPAQETPVPTHERPVRKGRPRRRKGEFLFGLPQIAVTAVWLAIILVTGVTLGRMLWVCAADVLAFGREDKMVTVTIYESDTMDDIVDKLHKGGLIRYPGLFHLYADLAVDEGEIKPGIWDLNTMYDYHALVNMMSPSSTRTVVEDVLIPEGYSCRQIFELLEQNRICTAKDLAEYAASGELKEYWFLENVERGFEYCLEGFLFPDTYDFYKNSSPRDVLEKLLDNFEYRFNEEMRSQIDALNANVTGGTFDIHDVVIVASLIEKETANNEESPLIASVIYNRLFNWGGTPAYLNIDASIVYALDGKTDLTTEDLKVESPYNTYTNTGLTPGAIANPGLASLKAALNPADTNYYFYVLNPAVGEHKFSTTLDEHNAFIASLE